MSNQPVSKSVQNRITITLFTAQSLFSAALIAVFTVMPILAVQLGGSDRVAGWPSTAILIGRAAIAYPVGWLMDRIGRRYGLSLGYGLAILGMGLAMMSIIWGSFVGFLLGAMLFGMGRGASEQVRFVAAEVFTEDRRAKVIGMIVFAGTIGAVGGPLLASPSSRAAEWAGLDAGIGPYALAIGLLALVLALVFIFLRPDPLTISRQLNGKTGADTAVPLSRPLFEILQQKPVILAIAAMAIGQLVMTLIMVITPLHMNRNQHGQDAVSFVIMAHTLGMFGLSGVTGWLIDRYGRLLMIVMGGVILVAASLMTPISTGVPILAAALFLLGLGWNFAFVAGSSLLSDALAAEERGRVQGASEVLVALASGAASLGTGEIFNSGGIVAVSSAGLAFSLALMAAVALFSMTQRVAVRQ